MSGEPKILRCDDVAPLLVFYSCDEVSAEEREQIAAHLANCSECSAQLMQEDALRDAIGHIPQAADQFDTANVLLSQCRSVITFQQSYPDDLALLGKVLGYGDLDMSPLD